MSEGPGMLSGESFIGEGAEAAHINVVLGQRSGPVGVAWVTALAAPRPVNAALVVVLQPGLPVKPMTLFVNKATIASDDHATLTWGAAQAGVAGGVADAVATGIVTEAGADDLLLIAAVWVNPAARDADRVYANNRAATAAALRASVRGEPRLADVLAAADQPANPLYVPPSAPASPQARPGTGAAGPGTRPPGPGTPAAP